MIRSMYAAVSGLRAHQNMMDVVGNNISNVNTTGFKRSRIIFQDILSQTLQGASEPQSGFGGTNPMQIGLGTRVAAITPSLSQGALQRTGRPLDVAIEGDGFFVVSQAGERLFTRAGAFFVDESGSVVTAAGGRIQGWGASTTGGVDTTTPPGNLLLPVGDLIPPSTTTSVTLGGNLGANEPLGTVERSGVDIYDAQGSPITIDIAFTKTAADEWTVAATYGDPAVAIPLTDNVVTFDSNGEIAGPADFGIDAAAGTVPGVGAFVLGLGAASDARKVTQYGEVTSVSVITQDGSATGALQSLSVGQDGVMIGAYSNGRVQPIGQLAVAIFANAEGMERVTGTNFRETPNSGLPQIGPSGNGGRGIIASGALEMANVDLAEEFTQLIVSQRGFQANSRVVTASDELLQEIVNLKR
ncbi:MAG: flagellar hook protein FlgE [Actinomycetia bacterium]|nr:flagellar hook protein FlgE [Actinomycetes bacterium]